MKRPNLRVITGAHVTGSHLRRRPRNRRDLQARGQAGDGKAGREVILSGGSVNSPQLLQLAGIGPAEHLKGSASMCVSTIPMSGAISRTISAPITPTAPIARPSTSSSVPGGASSIGRHPLSAVARRTAVGQPQPGRRLHPHRPGKTRPNMQLYFQAFSTVIPRPGERPILSPDPWPGFSIGWSNCRPKSRGEIMIRSADPFGRAADHAQCAVA
jgi:choline dehydrogenase